MAKAKTHANTKSKGASSSKKIAKPKPTKKTKKEPKTKVNVAPKKTEEKKDISNDEVLMHMEEDDMEEVEDVEKKDEDSDEENMDQPSDIQSDDSVSDGDSDSEEEFVIYKSPMKKDITFTLTRTSQVVELTNSNGSNTFFNELIQGNGDDNMAALSLVSDHLQDNVAFYDDKGPKTINLKNLPQWQDTSLLKGFELRRLKTDPPNALKSLILGEMQFESIYNSDMKAVVNQVQKFFTHNGAKVKVVYKTPVMKLKMKMTDIIPDMSGTLKISAVDAETAIPWNAIKEAPAVKNAVIFTKIKEVTFMLLI